MLRRHEIVLLCAIGAMLCYADRTNIGVAIAQFQPDHSKQGVILSAFFYGYICSQWLGGYLAEKYGAKIVLIGGVLVWTIFDILTVPFAHENKALIVTRAMMGLGEGVLFPCLHHIAACWYPQQERARLVSIVSGGLDLGTILAQVLSPLIVKYYDWQHIFVIYGILSIIWVICFVKRGASNPDTDLCISSAEQRYIIQNRGSKSTFTASSSFGNPKATGTSVTNLAHTRVNHVPWRILFSHPGAIAIYVAHFCFNYGWYVLLGWTPQYFQQKLHLDIGVSGIYAALPYICGYISVVLFGLVSDCLIRKGFRTLFVRKLMNSIGFFGCALFLYLLRYATSTAWAVLLLCLTLFCGRASTLGYWINMIDVGPEHASHIMGVSNTIATIPGIVGNIVTGIILGNDNNWDFVFGIASGLLIIGGAEKPDGVV